MQRAEEERRKPAEPNVSPDLNEPGAEEPGPKEPGPGRPSPGGPWL